MPSNAGAILLIWPPNNIEIIKMCIFEIDHILSLSSIVKSSSSTTTNTNLVLLMIAVNIGKKINLLHKDIDCTLD